MPSQTHRRPSSRRRAALAALLAAAIAAAGAAHAATGGTTAATKTTSSLKVHVYGTTRRTDLRVGEPLGFSYHLRYRPAKVKRVCWSPAPIDRPACSSLFAAPATAGTQRVAVELADGTTIHARYEIGPAPSAATLPASYAVAQATGAHTVLYRATCDEPAKEELHQDGRERPGPAKYAVRAGDHLAAINRKPGGYVSALDFRDGQRQFDYALDCLEPVVR